MGTDLNHPALQHATDPGERIIEITNACLTLALTDEGYAKNKDRILAEVQACIENLKKPDCPVLTL